MTGETPLLRAKNFAAPSVFLPENLLREARRQKGHPAGEIPNVCVLDPDGDIVRQLRADGSGRLSPHWACYHTDLYVTEHRGQRVGVVGCAVGASFAVLVAEQMFASGCELLVSVTSSGQIVPAGPPPYFVLIDTALRDEGTSHHYLPPALFAEADPALADTMMRAAEGGGARVLRGASWPRRLGARRADAAVALSGGLKAERRP